MTHNLQIGEQLRAKIIKAIENGHLYQIYETRPYKHDRVIILTGAPDGKLTSAMIAAIVIGATVVSVAMVSLAAAHSAAVHAATATAATGKAAAVGTTIGDMAATTKMSLWIEFGERVLGLCASAYLFYRIWLRGNKTIVIENKAHSPIDLVVFEDQAQVSEETQVQLGSSDAADEEEEEDIQTGEKTVTRGVGNANSMSLKIIEQVLDGLAELGSSMKKSLEEVLSSLQVHYTKKVEVVLGRVPEKTIIDPGEERRFLVRDFGYVIAGTYTKCYDPDVFYGPPKAEPGAKGYVIHVLGRKVEDKLELQQPILLHQEDVVEGTDLLTFAHIFISKFCSGSEDDCGDSGASSSSLADQSNGTCAVSSQQPQPPVVPESVPKPTSADEADDSSSSSLDASEPHGDRIQWTCSGVPGLVVSGVVASPQRMQYGRGADSDSNFSCGL